MSRDLDVYLTLNLVWDTMRFSTWTLFFLILEKYSSFINLINWLCFDWFSFFFLFLRNTNNFYLNVHLLNSVTIIISSSSSVSVHYERSHQIYTPLTSVVWRHIFSFFSYVDLLSVMTFLWFLEFPWLTYKFFCCVCSYQSIFSPICLAIFCFIKVMFLWISLLIPYSSENFWGKFSVICLSSFKFIYIILFLRILTMPYS